MVHCLGKLTLISYLRILVVNFYLAVTILSKSLKFIRNFIMSFFSGGQISTKPPMSNYIIWNNKDNKSIYYRANPNYVKAGILFCHLAFTRDRRNWTNFYAAKCASLGPAFFQVPNLHT